MIPVYVGYDEREAVAYHTFCQSILSRSSEPVSFTPLVLNAMKHIYDETHTDGSNAFIYSRFLVPYLQGYKGWAMFADGDMTCHEDIAKLWALIDPSKAVMVVKHDYKTKFPTKYLGNKNADYPRKNWSSVILFNCAHPANKGLTPEFIENATGAQLHRFTWLSDDLIGELPIEWNWLDSEYESNDSAKLIHYTVGTPCFTEYQSAGQAKKWWAEYIQSILPLKGAGMESYINRKLNGDH
jgi:lipopolysaccharide biosynthesis glycosyltransferase